MNILICGGTGFIGKAIGARLEGAGHRVLYGVRTRTAPNQITIDYSRDLTIEDWLPRLQGIDAVINAVGILVERNGQTFASVHRDAPIALFQACAQAGVTRVIQISALGADRGNTPYFTTKRAADDALMGMALDWHVLRPALIYGDSGDSASFFRVLASLPVIPLPAGGKQQLQPIHIDDLCEAVTRLLDPATPSRQCIELVGAASLSYRDMLCTYRMALGLPPAPTFAVPGLLMTACARMLDFVPGAILTSDTWRMLQDGNTGDAGPTGQLLQRPPRAITNFIHPQDAPALRAQALAAWRNPLLRVVLALVWIATAVISAFIYPVADSLTLLAAVGLTGIPALVALYGAAALDAAFGLATLVHPSRRLWLLQMVTIAAYSIIIVIALPQFLVHPFGPVLKNLPILALLAVLLSEEQGSLA